MTVPARRGPSQTAPIEAPLSKKELTLRLIACGTEFGRAHLQEYNAAREYHRHGGTRSSRDWDNAREELRIATRALEKAALALHEAEVGQQ